MQHHHTTIPFKNGVVCLYGYGIKVHVKYNHLILEDGICDERRSLKLHKATSGLKRLVILSRDGYITLDAIQWLRDIGTALTVIGTDNEVLIADAPASVDLPHIRRAQALAPYNGVDLVIMKKLIADKVNGQIRVLQSIDRNSEILENHLSSIETCETIHDLTAIEAFAALTYWQEIASLPVRFAQKDTHSIPSHWLTFGIRQSPITNDARKAATPANSILNYAYGLLKSEGRIAVLTMGIDPSLSFMHTDRIPNGFVYDVIEPVRPTIDMWLIQFLTEHVLTRDDFSETERGEVRLSFSLRSQVTSIAPFIAQEIASYVEWIAQMLAGETHVPTVMTANNKRKKPLKRIRVKMERFCLDCGKPTVRNNQYCKDCLPNYRLRSIEKAVVTP